MCFFLAVLAALIKRWQFCSVNWSVWNISTTSKCFAMKFAADIQVPMRTNPSDIGGSLTFPLAPQAGQSFHWNISTSTWWIGTNIQDDPEWWHCRSLKFSFSARSGQNFTLSSTAVYAQAQNCIGTQFIPETRFVLHMSVCVRSRAALCTYT